MIAERLSVQPTDKNIHEFLAGAKHGTLPESLAAMMQARRHVNPRHSLKFHHLSRVDAIISEFVIEGSREPLNRICDDERFQRLFPTA